MWKTGRNSPYIFLCWCEFLLCLLFLCNILDLPSNLLRSYHSGMFWSSCCSCLLESCWSASAITLLFPASYNTLPSSDSLSPSSIHNIKSSLKHCMEQGHLKLLIFRFYFNALPFLSSHRSSSYTSSRRNRNLSCEKVSSMDTWIDKSNMTDFVICDCGTVFEWSTEEIERMFPWISALMQRNGYLALAEWNNATVDQSAWLWIVKHRYSKRIIGLY